MGSKQLRTGKQILFYFAACMTVFLCGCALINKQADESPASLMAGNHEQAMTLLDNSEKMPGDSDFIGYFLLFADRTSPFCDIDRAEAYLNFMKNRYPDKMSTACAAQVMSDARNRIMLEQKNETLKNDLDTATNSRIKQISENTALTESLKKAQTETERLGKENSELNERLKALITENEQLKEKLEKMKEVDMKLGKKIIGD